MSNWYLQNGKESDVVISSKVEFARNLKDFPFLTKTNESQEIEIIKKVENVLMQIGYSLKMIKIQNLDEVTKMSLLEKNIISSKFIFNNIKNKAILINDEENICIMINEEDHLKIQVITSGFDIENAMNLAIELDEKIGELLNIAVHEKYGYLTVSPTNIGTGLKASIIAHLSGLTKTGNIVKILEVVRNLGMNIKEVDSEDRNEYGDIYQIYNKQTLGVSEKEIIKNIKVITEKIIEQERVARNILSKDSVELEDIVYRSYGILYNCKKISYKECKKLLSNVKLGVDLGIIKELTDFKVKELELYTKPANLQKRLGKKIDEYELEIKRAETIRQIIDNNK